jgi:transposase
MGRHANKLHLESRISTILEKGSRNGKQETRLYKRIQIIRSSGLGKSNKAICKEEKCSSQKIRKWRTKWNNLFPTKSEIETMTDKEIWTLISQILSDEKRSGTPPIFTESELVRVKSLACEKPEKYGLPFSKWTYIELSKQSKKMGINISSSHIERVLKKRNITA